jgi:PAS domain S-box-containing protein
MPRQERRDQQFQELLGVLQFTEDISVKLRGLDRESDIYSTLAEESLRSGIGAVGILLLDKAGLHLVPASGPFSPPGNRLRATPDVAGVGPELHTPKLARSSQLGAVLQEGCTIHERTMDLVRAGVLPPVAADVVQPPGGHRSRFCIITPLHRQGTIIGVLVFLWASDARHLIPSVTNLARHITYTLEALDARRQSAQAEATLHALLNAPPAHMFLIDSHGIVLAANEPVADTLRRKMNELVGCCIYDLLPPQVAAPRRRYVQQAIHSGQPVRFQDQREGRTYAQSVFPMRDADGNVGKLVIFAHDVTEQRRLVAALEESERRFRQMAEVIPVGFWMRSPDGQTPLYIGPAVERIYGYPLHDFRRRPSLWWEVLHPEDREWVQSFWKEHDGQATEVHYRIVRADGETRWVRDVCAPVRDQAGVLTLVTGYLEDVTEAKRSAAQLMESEKLSALGVLAGGIAHGLRNPLGIISACAHVLREHPGNAEWQAECTEKIEAATRRGSQIIESLLKLARPQKTEMTMIDVRSVLESTFTLLADHLISQRVMLVKMVPAELPEVYGSAELLQQVFTELMLNACNAMPDGGTLTMSAQTREASWVEIRFHDTGHGIAPEHLPRIFEPFFTTMQVGKGSGLGLSIIHSIIEEHHGRIAVQSELGQGATFTVGLPVKRDDQGGDHGATADTHSGRG